MKRDILIGVGMAAALAQLAQIESDRPRVRYPKVESLEHKELRESRQQRRQRERAARKRNRK